VTAGSEKQLGPATQTDGLFQELPGVFVMLRLFLPEGCSKCRRLLNLDPVHIACTSKLREDHSEPAHLMP